MWCKKKKIKGRDGGRQRGREGEEETIKERRKKANKKGRKEERRKEEGMEGERKERVLLFQVIEENTTDILYVGS